MKIDEITYWDTDLKKGSAGGLESALNIWHEMGDQDHPTYILGNGHHLHEFSQHWFDRTYYIVTNANDKITAYVMVEANGKAQQVGMVFASIHNTYPLYAVYAYLVKKLGIMLMSDDTQTDAGQAVWHKLSAEPGITVFGWNTKTRKAINLGDKLDHDTEGDTHSLQPKLATSGNDPVPNPDPAAKDVVLVAIKK